PATLSTRATVGTLRPSSRAIRRQVQLLGRALMIAARSKSVIVLIRLGRDDLSTSGTSGVSRARESQCHARRSLRPIVRAMSAIFSPAAYRCAISARLAPQLLAFL